MPLQHQPVPDIVPLPLDARQAPAIGVAVQGLDLHHLPPQQALQSGPRLLAPALAQLRRIQAFEPKFLGSSPTQRLHPQSVAIADMGDAPLPQARSLGGHAKPKRQQQR